MSTVQSLEQERQAILERMQMRRDAYRRILNGEEGFDAVPPRSNAGNGVNGSAVPAHALPVRRLDQAPMDMAGEGRRYAYRHVPDSFPRTRLMKTVAEHPMLWALGVAAVLAIGPRRIARTVTTGGATLGTLAASQSGMDMLGRVLTLAGAVAQRRGS